MAECSEPRPGSALLTEFQAFVLGAIQGLTEFLPVSSSGHLIAIPWILGWRDHSLSFDVALHLGTLGAVFSALMREWKGMAKDAQSAIRGFGLAGLWRDAGARRLLLIAVASIPGGVAGLLLDDLAERTFRSALLVAGSMAVMGALLLVADRSARGARSLSDWNLKDALVMGCAQATALVPGVSRSGATITSALFLGFERDAAARVSFLMALPLTAAACLLKVPKLLAAGLDPLLVIGIVTAFGFGFASIGALFAWVRTRSYLPFVIYRFLFAAVIVGLWWIRA